MKKIRLSIIIIGVMMYSTIIKGQQLDRQIIASAGMTNTAGSFTIGEVIVLTNNLQVISGFQQPEFITSVLSSVKDITDELSVYPVPTRNAITIKGKDFQPESTIATLYTPDGRTSQILISNFQNEMNIDLSQLPSGNYYLTLSNQTNGSIANYKILKLK